MTARSRRTHGGRILPTKLRTKLVIVVAAVAAAAYYIPEVGERLSNGWDSLTGSVEIVGDGDAWVMVSGSAKSEAKKCTARQMIDQKRCGDRKVLLVDAKKMPFIARNTKLAWESGRPAVLTMNRAMQGANRGAACPRSFPRLHGGQCDEYPMAVTSEGGKQARAEEVPGRENSCQGGMYGAQYPKQDGETFLVVITDPDLIATVPFTGADIAKDQGWC